MDNRWRCYHLNNTYDTIIIGCGPAGMACGLHLASSGNNCLILEKRPAVEGKVCGDALSIEGVKLLPSIGLDIDRLGAAGGKPINSHVIRSDGNIIDETSFYGETAFGISRDIFDKLLLENVIDAGATVIFEKRVSKILRVNEGYCVNDTFFAKRIVVAAGTTGALQFGGYRANCLPVGISARIRCVLPLNNNCFYVNRDSGYRGGYSWIFPIGDNLWNIGVWSPDNEVKKRLRQEYVQFENREIRSRTGNISYDRKPKGAMIGSFDQRYSSIFEETNVGRSEVDFSFVGDNALKASNYSGEGIRFAIESGIREANLILNGG